MSVAALVRSMVNAGATPEVIALAVEAVEAERAAAEQRVNVRSSGAERTRRYRERGGGKIPPDMRRAVFDRDGNACLDCGSIDHLHCDHVIPVSKGGETSMENLQTLCRVCNCRKRDRIRKRDVRGVSTENADMSADIPESTLSRPLPPQTPPTPTHTRDGNTTHARGADPVDEIEPPPKRRTGQRLPPDWRPSPQDTAYAESQSLKPDEISRVAEDFRDYWTARAGEAGRKLDWPATWRTWVRRHLDRRAGSGMASRPAYRGGGGQGATDFASILAERRGRGGNPDDVSAGGEAIPGAFRVVG